MKRNRVLSLVLVFALLLCLTSCGKKETEEPAAEATATRTVITLTSPFATLASFEAAFETAYPQYDLQCEYLASGVINGEITRRLRNHHGSDLVVTNLPSGEVQAYAYDLSTEAVVEKYSARVMKATAIDGISRYIPLPGAVYGFIVNKTLLDELGLPLPETKSDLLAICAAAQEKGIGVSADGYCMGIGTIGSTYLGALFVSDFATDFLSTADGARWVDNFESGNATFTGTWENCASFFRTSVEKGYLNPQKLIIYYNQTMSSNANAFKSEVELPNRTAILSFDDLYYYDEICALSDDEFVMLPMLPEDSSGNAMISAVSSNYLFINNDIASDETRLKGALSVMEFLSTQEGQALWIQDAKTPNSFLVGFETAEGLVSDSLYAYIQKGMLYENPFPTDLLTKIGEQFYSVVAKGTDVSAALAAIDDYVQNGDSTASLSMEIVGTVEDDMIYQNNNVRYEETAIGNLVADAVRELSGADIALVNGGGIRSSLYKGDVTSADLSAVCPYSNLIIVSEMDGATLRAAITNGIQKTWKPAGQFLQVSGLCYSFSPASSGEETAVLLTLTHTDGTEIKDDEIFTVAYTNYMGGSQTYTDAGDGYTMLNVYDTNLPITVKLVKETGATFTDALKAYFANHADEKISSVLEGRITVVQ